MHYSELILLLCFGLIVWFWQDSARVKELASRAGFRVCRQAQVHFLDETVEFTGLRFRRDSQGSLRLRREYRFEFSSDGSRRYQGEITMLGHRLETLTMEPYRDSSDFDES